MSTARNIISYLGLTPDPAQNPDLQVRMVICNVSALLALVMALVFSTIQLAAGLGIWAILNSLPVAIIGLTLVFTKCRCYLVARVYFILVAIAELTFFSWYYGPDIGLKYILVAACITPFTLLQFSERRLMILCFAAIAMSLAAIELLSYHEVEPVLAIEPSLRKVMKLVYVIFALVALALQGGLLFYLNERKDRKLVETMAKQQLSAKMYSLGEMASGMAHEINNPLAVILGKIGQLRKRLQEGPPDVDKLTVELKKLEDSAMRIARIVKGLRSFSRDSPKDPFETVAVSAIIEETLVLCQERFSHQGIELRVRQEAAAWISCRPTQISQIIMNLLSNAYDAAMRLPERWVECQVTLVNHLVRITVTDSGRGIPPEVATRIMEPFYTTKGVGAGTGLGLSIARGIAEEHGGRLWYEINGRHTSLVLELPAAKPLV